MIILGIDPGTVSMGYALVGGNRQKPQLQEAGLIDIKSPDTCSRLKEVHTGITSLIKRFRPDALSIERLFFAKNQKTALSVAEARGVVLLTTTLARLRVYEYTPLEIKKNITGDGSADKEQLKKMIRFIFPETIELKVRDDVFDAIAVALTCIYRENI